MSAQPDTPLPWHDRLWHHLAAAIRHDRVAHGLLICGPPGVGKRRLAARLAQALVCFKRNDDQSACGACPACRQYAAGTHPDISRLEPPEPGRLIKVEQVRAFGHRLHLTPQYRGGRVGWIDPADQLSLSAANSLLKTLEEPPIQCHILLITPRVSAIPATIRSRCQTWRVPSPGAAAARAWLREQGVTPDARELDSLRAPLTLLQRRERDYTASADAWDRDLAGLLQGQQDAVELAARFRQQPADLWLDWLYRRASALLAYVLNADSANLEPALQQAAVGLDAEALQSWCGRVGETARVSHTNADWQLTIESLLLDLQARLPVEA